MPNAARWQRDWTRLGLPIDTTLHARLSQRYSEPQRHYHTLQHLRECFALLDSLAVESSRYARIALALWFHDAIYEPQRKDNEARSADWAADSLRAAGAPPALIESIVKLILATCHRQVPEDDDARLLVDIDLAILGASAARFAVYERQIRSEYAHVPDLEYRHGRATVLRQFQQREPLFQTPAVRARLEGAAHHNLAHSIAELTPSETP